MPIDLQTISIIKSIQRGTVTISPGSSSATSTITAVDLTKSFIVHLGSRKNDTSAMRQGDLSTIELTNATTVTARVGSSVSGSAGMTVGYCVVEYI